MHIAIIIYNATLVHMYSVQLAHTSVLFCQTLALSHNVFIRSPWCGLEKYIDLYCFEVNVTQSCLFSFSSISWSFIAAVCRLIISEVICNTVSLLSVLLLLNNISCNWYLKAKVSIYLLHVALKFWIISLKLLLIQDPVVSTSKFDVLLKGHEISVISAVIIWYLRNCSSVTNLQLS